MILVQPVRINHVAIDLYIYVFFITILFSVTVEIFRLFLSHALLKKSNTKSLCYLFFRKTLEQLRTMDHLSLASFLFLSLVRLLYM